MRNPAKGEPKQSSRTPEMDRTALDYKVRAKRSSIRYGTEGSSTAIELTSRSNIHPRRSRFERLYPAAEELV